MEGLADPTCRGALLLGEPGVGKTTLLTMAGDELHDLGRTVFSIPLAGLRDAGEIGRRMLDAVGTVDPGVGRTIRSSAGGPSLDESIGILRKVRRPPQRWVVLLDGLDEAPYPARMAGAIEQLIQLEDWQFIVTSRQDAAGELRRFASFYVVVLGNLGKADAAGLLRAYTPGLPDEIIDRIVEFTGGLPVFLQLVARQLGERSAVWEAQAGAASSLEHALEWLVNQAIEASPDPEKKGLLLEELALAGGRDTIARLAAKTHLTPDDVRNLLAAPRARALVTVDESAATAALFHDLLRDVIVSQRILQVPFRIADLRFGDEAAERDELLNVSYVQRPSAETILSQDQTIVVGNRGSGKSAIFRKLAEATSPADEQSHAEIYPVTNTGDLLHKIIAGDAAWLDTDALRAAWLVVVAALVAKAIPASAPKNLLRDAAALRAALGLPVQAGAVSLARRALRASGRLVGGTTLKFAVGPAELEVQIPSDTAARTGKAPVDVDSFLREMDRLLDEAGRRALVMFDRIDETFKYDRPRQQAVVQALLLAEAQVSLLGDIRLIVFLRTDLFELYDIQEKNKLVSRTLTIDWEEEEWLQVLVRRVLANKPLERLARRLGAADTGDDVRVGLEVLFPPEIEGQPVDRWLIDSLHNGNGDVSPRLAILLLYLARQRAARPGAVVSTLPLFSGAEAGEAMTKLSDLSFSEVVNDFKVAPSFVQNCRAGKLETFALDDVRDLFDETEGKISDQVRLLERLGFLERIVQERSVETGIVRESLFRIPRLYTRCWGYA